MGEEIQAALRLSGLARPTKAVRCSHRSRGREGEKGLEGYGGVWKGLERSGEIWNGLVERVERTKGRTIETMGERGERGERKERKERKENEENEEWARKGKRREN